MSMDKKLLAQLEIYKLTDTKPNFSALSRKYGVDRRTIKKYNDGYEGKPSTREHHSKLDRYEDLIRIKMQIQDVKYRDVYDLVFEESGGTIGTYSNFRKYAINRGITPKKKGRSGYPRFETAPGHQAQVDWKEDISINNKYGEVFVLQVFDYKLGHSRYILFIYRRSKTQQDVIDCLIESFKTTGGVPEEILFDNMTSIVSFNGGHRNVSNRMIQFAKDFGFKMRFAKPRSPETKGKVETANKFMSRLKVYDGDFETESELINILAKINKKVNTEVSPATNVPPILLFQKEKELLKPLPSKHVVESYLGYDRTTRVSKDSMITYKNAKYSTPPKYIGKNVSLKEVNGRIAIYFEGIRIAEHEICDKKINYLKEHYVELLRPLVNDDDVEAIAEENLRQFDMLL